MDSSIRFSKTEDVDYVIASDTDSIYINFGGIVESFLKKFDGDKQKTVDMIDKICQDQLEPFIDKSYQQLSEYVNAYDQKMQMKRENILFDRGIWTTRRDTF